MHFASLGSLVSLGYAVSSAGVTDLLLQEICGHELEDVDVLTEILGVQRIICALPLLHL